MSLSPGLLALGMVRPTDHSPAPGQPALGLAAESLIHSGKCYLWGSQALCWLLGDSKKKLQGLH